MTEEQALAKFEKMMHQMADDPEGQHNNADDLLIEALRSLGWNRLADKWAEAAGDWGWA